MKSGRPHDPYLCETLSTISENGPNVTAAYDFKSQRETLVGKDKVGEPLPDFVIACRTSRDFWNYIEHAFKSYADHSRYIEAQLLPIERQFRGERKRAPGERLVKVRIEYSSVCPVSAAGLSFVSESRLAELRKLQSPSFDFRRLVRLCE